MNDRGVPLVRIDGLSVDLAVTLGGSARVFCEPEDPRLLGIDLGHSYVRVVAVDLSPDVLMVVRQVADVAVVSTRLGDRPCVDRVGGTAVLLLSLIVGFGGAVVRRARGWGCGLASLLYRRMGCGGGCRSGTRSSGQAGRVPGHRPGRRNERDAFTPALVLVLVRVRVGSS